MTHQVRSILPDKRSWHHEQTTPDFFDFMHHYEGASSEVWHTEVDYLDIHFAEESEKCESMEHYDKSLAFWLHF